MSNMIEINTGTFCWFSNNGEAAQSFGRLKKIQRSGASTKYLSSDGQWYSYCGALAKRMHQIKFEQAS
jgi:hypothetical protein